jgi:hypothetical protein
LNRSIGTQQRDFAANQVPIPLALCVSCLNRFLAGRCLPVLPLVLSNIKKPKFGSIETLPYLPELLSCRGNCFAADAREGGSWIREASDRYTSFREPLSALLLARVPSNFPFASGPVNDPYYELIVQDGGLISCLVSLASAAGNDILWKPLNHAVLNACGMEGRVEIQRAGLTCLLKLMNTLGEEHMVLLPECLPVLSKVLRCVGLVATSACVQYSAKFSG